MDEDRLRSLYEAKTRALVAGEFGVGERASMPLPGGAALFDDRCLWVYAPIGAPALGRALALAAPRSLPEVHVLVDDESAGMLARRAAVLRPPAHVWRVRERSLEAAEIEPLPEASRVPDGAEPVVAMLHAAGLEVIVEHGVVLGEVRGLEVARVRPGPDGHVLDVGVGRFDQAANALLYGDLPTDLALARVAREVQSHRHAGAVPHPVNRLARERWLRAQVVDAPQLVGATRLEPVPPPLPRPNLKVPCPAPAVGVDDADRCVLVVCSVGTDLDLVPVAADLIARELPERVVLVTPARDQLPVLRAMASRLPVTTELVAVEGDWPR